MMALIVLDTIDSTNAKALRRARGGERGSLWIVAERQSAGRGRRGRSWVSPRGNLHATLLVIDPGAGGLRAAARLRGWPCPA
jgi:BirA family biotin operon repressor/biotin-[acetyl-CoA-carboxylase] ligase